MIYYLLQLQPRGATLTEFIEALDRARQELAPEDAQVSIPDISNGWLHISWYEKPDPEVGE